MGRPEIHMAAEHRSIPWHRLPSDGYLALWDIAQGVPGLPPESFAVRVIEGGELAEAWELPAAVGAAIKASREGQGHRG